MTADFKFSVIQHRDVKDPAYRAAMDHFIANRAGGLRGSGIDPDRPQPPLVDKWTVSLPHQCDEWKITEEYGESSHREAVEALKEFIEQARQALAALEARREVVQPW